MVHVIPQSELGRARQRLKRKKAAGGTCLLDRNSSRMQEASEGDRCRWEELLVRCRSETGDGDGDGDEGTTRAR